VVVFGASGDLSRRKILSALGSLARNGSIRVVRAGRTEMTGKSFRDLVGRASGSADLDASAEWVRLSYDTPAAYRSLRRESLDEVRPIVYYLATPPATYTSIVAGLASAGLAGHGSDARVVVEKPLGWDGARATEINARLAEVFEEEQIFRIDHYLAKDTVQ
jgi:glucose-6-phosphate 1-dehydrogenase